MAAAQAMFWAFSVVMGMSLADIALIYTGDSIARVFLITAATFGGMSLFGYTTKKRFDGNRLVYVYGLVGNYHRQHCQYILKKQRFILRYFLHCRIDFYCFDSL